jgi:ubiquinone/menaquinone biosynthesis C-methylase UbiE
MNNLKEECSRFYNKEAGKYDARRYYCKCRIYHDELSKDTVFNLVKNAETILDVGTGTGRFAIFLAKKGKNIVAVDQSSEMLEVAKQKSIEDEVSDFIEFVQGDVERLPFEDNTFEAVISIHVMTHFNDINNFISEIARVLKPGGIFVFDLSESFTAKAYQFIRNIIFQKPQTYPDYFRNLIDLENDLNKYGIHKIGSKKIKKFPRLILHFFLCTLNSVNLFNLQKRIEQYNFGSLTILKCQKLP